MRTIRGSWQTAAGQLICRWSTPRQVQVSYKPPWMQNASETSHTEGASPMDFTRLSPLAGRGWFERTLEGFTSRPTHSLPDGITVLSLSALRFHKSFD